ncbi:MAG: HD domain-containing protein [Candidatus Eisenbacteria bacterium]
MELDRLKSIYRRAYVSDGSRRENSAEHSWHLALALLALQEWMPEDIDVDHAIRIALVHDICEIGAGDISVYDPDRSKQAAREAAYIAEFSTNHAGLGSEVATLWREYEDQQTQESRWVKIADRFLPFLLNLASEGRTWKEQGISRSQVLEVNKSILAISPDFHEWMVGKIDKAVELGWLKDA